MPDIKEKLVELLDDVQVYGIDANAPYELECPCIENEDVADHLIIRPEYHPIGSIQTANTF